MIHIFNPEHDIALGAHVEQFTAPHAARQLRHDLGFLPMIWAEEGDKVIVEDVEAAKEAFRHLGLKAKGSWHSWKRIAEVLDVNYRSLYEPTLYAAEDVMYTLFELDEHYPGTRLYEVTDTTDPDLPEKHMAVSFRYRLLDEFLKEWQLRKKQLWEGEITKEEYLEWKLNWPQTADGCGRYEPKKKWRKE